MKQAGYTKRSYDRSSERQKQSHTKQPYGTPAEGKMRGNPQQNVEKYLTLARDATSLGDPISAENYYQFADHYYRLVAASRPSRPSPVSRKVQESVQAEQFGPPPSQSENLLD